MKEFFLIFSKNFLFAVYNILDSIVCFGSNIRHFFRNSLTAIKYSWKISAPYFKAFKNKVVIIWCCICVAVIITVIILLNLTANYYHITYNGTHIGYSRNINTVNSTISALIEQFDDNNAIKQDLKLFNVSEIQTSNWFLSCLNGEKLKDAIVETADTIDYAYGVYVDGKGILYSSSKKTVENAVNDYRDDRVSLSEDIKKSTATYNVEWLVDFEVKKECVSAELITSEKIYDTLYSLLEEKLPYRINCTQVTEESILYITKYERNANLAAGSKKVIQKGSRGVKEVTTRLVIENGQLISSEVLDEKVTKNARTCKIQVGSDVNEFSNNGLNLILPVEGYVTSPYGKRKDPFTGEPAHHNGLDIAAPMGTDVLAAASGKIIKASDTGNGYGKCVIIEHYSGFRTLYGHCSELLVSVGDYIRPGELIARVGSTGRSTGPHVHFSVIIDGEYMDPSVYF